MRVMLEMQEDWQELRAGNVPPRLVQPTELALGKLRVQIDARNRSETRAASVDAAYTINDRELRYKPVAKVDAMRFDLWARRAQLDAEQRAIGYVRSDFVTLEWLRDRIAHPLKPLARTRLDTLIRDLGTAVGDEDMDVAARIAQDLPSARGAREMPGSTAAVYRDRSSSLPAISTHTMFDFGE